MSIANRSVQINIDRTYNLTSGTIYIERGFHSEDEISKWSRRSLLVSGTGEGRFIKEDAGFNVLTMYNTENPNYSYDYFEAEFEVEGWSPDRNNISVTVNKMNSEGTLVIPFPKKGDVPMIIAFDPTVNWMVERESIPATWFE